MYLPDSASIWVIVPAFNEHSTIHETCAALQKEGYTVVVVDDGSEPALRPSLPAAIHYMRHRVNLGQGAALQTGMEFAIERGASILVSFDADGQHQSSDIPLLTAALQDKNADIALGSRFLGARSNMGFSRRALLQAARLVNFIFTGLLLTDAHNGLRAIRAEAASKIRFTENGMSHATELLTIIRKQKLRYTEVPVTINYTTYSKSKGQSGFNSFRILFDLLLNKLFR